MSTLSVGTVLAHDDWRAREARHHERVDALSAGHRARNSRGEKHAIEDFLWTYYPYSPADLRRWHPGAGVALEATPTDTTERANWRYYVTHEFGDGGVHFAVDPVSFFEKRAQTVDYIEQLLAATIDRTPQFGCFGLHEWAMVYRLTPEQIRHTRLPLRIGHEATDLVVESNPISCTHFDAYRFFTSDAVSLNRLTPTRLTQPEFEQSACLHAGMDIYKWATKLGPIIPGELLADAFELARDIRVVDMQASPYDVSGFTGADGRRLPAIAIETPEGKREYVRLQRGFSDRGNALRVRVLEAIAVAREALTIS